MTGSAVYLMCWAATPYPFGVRPCHYLGVADAVPGAAHGIEWHHVRVWPGGDRYAEAYLKDLNDRRILCPDCNPGTTAGVIIRPKRYRRATLQAMAS
jgi:hypothetical protein